MRHQDAFPQLDGTLRRITSLLERAEHPLTPEHEAASCRAKAEQLMKDYRIDEQNLIAQDQFAIVPILKKIELCPYFEGDATVVTFDFTNHYYSIFLRIAEHCGIRTNVKVQRVKENGDRWFFIAHCVGYDSDLRYAELIWLNARMAFGASVDPKVERDLSEEENIYRLRTAGIPRKDIAEMIWGFWNHSNSAKIAKIYKAECEKRGHPPAMNGRGINNKLYRQVFADEFHLRIYRRLLDMQDGAMSTGGALDLAGRSEKVDEKFFDLFPEMRPRDPEPAPEPTPEEAEKARKSLARSKGPTKAQMRKWEQLTYGSAAKAGRDSGRRAAESVVLTRSAPRTGRVKSTQDQGTEPNAGALSAGDG